MIQSVKLSLTVCLSFVVFYPPITRGETTEECNFGINCTCVYDVLGSFYNLNCNIKDTLPVLSGDHALMKKMEQSGRVHVLLSNFIESLRSTHKTNAYSVQTPKTPPIKANSSDWVFDNVKITLHLIHFIWSSTCGRIFHLL